MSVVKRIVCLANSRKPHGRCVAGKEVGEIGSWIRPVSDRPGEEVSEYERQYEDGSGASVLDVIDVPLKHHQPNGHQSENWMLDPEHYWVRRSRVTWQQLDKLVDCPERLWPTGYSTHHGLNDRVPSALAAALGGSLYLLRMDAVELRVFVPGETFGSRKRRVQARFTHRGVSYWLRVTDPVIEQEYLKKGESVFQVGECFLTISLAEPYEGFAYKLVATLITAERAGKP